MAISVFLLPFCLRIYSLPSYLSACPNLLFLGFKISLLFLNLVSFSFTVQAENWKEEGETDSLTEKKENRDAILCDPKQKKNLPERRDLKQFSDVDGSIAL